MSEPRELRPKPSPPKKPKPPTTSYADDRRTPSSSPAPLTGTPLPSRGGDRPLTGVPLPPRYPTGNRPVIVPPRSVTRFDSLRPPATTRPRLPDLSRAVSRPNPLVSGGAFEHRSPDVVQTAAEATYASHYGSEPVRARVPRPKAAPKSYLERNPGIAYQLNRVLQSGDQDEIAFTLSDILAGKFEDENQRLYDRLARRKTKMETWYSEAGIANAAGDLDWAVENPMPRSWSKMPKVGGNRSPQALQEEYLDKMAAAGSQAEMDAIERIYFGDKYNDGAIEYAQEREKTLGFQQNYLETAENDYRNEFATSMYWAKNKGELPVGPNALDQLLLGNTQNQARRMHQRRAVEEAYPGISVAAAIADRRGIKDIEAANVELASQPVEAPSSGPPEDYEKTLEEANPSVWDRFGDIGREVISLGSYDDATDNTFGGEINTFGLFGDDDTQKREAAEDAISHTSEEAPAGDPVEVGPTAPVMAEEGKAATAGIGGPPVGAMSGPLGLPANIWGGMNAAVDKAVQQPLAHKMEPVADGLWWSIDKISRPIYAQNAAVQAWYSLDKEHAQHERKGGINFLNPLDVVSGIYGKDITDSIDNITGEGLGHVVTSYGEGFTSGGWKGNAVNPILGHEIVHYNAMRDGAENMYDKGWVQTVFGLTGDVAFDPINFASIKAPLRLARMGLAEQRAAEAYATRSGALYDEIMTQEEVLTQAGIDPREVYTALMGEAGRRPWTAKGKARFQRDVEMGTTHVHNLLNKAHNELLASAGARQAESRTLDETIKRLEETARNLEARRTAVREHYSTNSAADIVNRDPTRVTMRTSSGSEIYRSTELAEHIEEANNTVAYYQRVAREMNARMPEAYKGYGGQGAHNPYVSEAANEAQAQGDALSHVLDAKSTTARANTDYGVEQRAMSEQAKNEARLEGYSRPSQEKSPYELKLEDEYDKAVAEGDKRAVAEIGKKLDQIDAGGAGIYSYAEVTRQLEEIAARGNPQEMAAFEAKLNAAHAKVDKMEGYKEGRDAEGILPPAVRMDPRLDTSTIRTAHRQSMSYARKQSGGGPRAKAVAIHNKITNLRREIKNKGTNVYRERRLKALETKYEHANLRAKRFQAADFLSRLKDAAAKAEAKERGELYVSDRERAFALGAIVREAKRLKGVTKSTDNLDDEARLAAEETERTATQARTEKYNETLASRVSRNLKLNFKSYKDLAHHQKYLADRVEKLGNIKKLPQNATWAQLKQIKDEAAEELRKFENAIESVRKDLDESGEFAEQYTGTGLAPETSMAGEAVAKQEKRTADRPEEGDYEQSQDLLNADNTPVEGLFDSKRGPFSYHSQLDDIIREAEKQQKELYKKRSDEDFMHDDETIKYLAPMFKDIDGNLDRAKFEEYFKFDRWGKIFEVNPAIASKLDPDTREALERIGVALDEKYQEHHAKFLENFHKKHRAQAEKEWESEWLDSNSDPGEIQRLLNMFGEPKSREGFVQDRGDTDFNPLKPMIRDPEHGKPLFLGERPERFKEIAAKSPKKGRIFKSINTSYQRMKDMDSLKDLRRSKASRNAMAEPAFVHGKTKSQDYSRKEMNSLLDEVYRHRGRPPIANPRDLFNHTMERYPEEVQAWAERHLADKAKKLEERLSINDIAAINRIRSELADAGIHLPKDNWDAFKELTNNPKNYEYHLSVEDIAGRRLFEEQHGMMRHEAENLRQRALGNYVEMDAGSWAAKFPQGITKSEFVAEATRDFDSFVNVMDKSRFHMSRLTKRGLKQSRESASAGIRREDYPTAQDYKRAIANAESDASKQWFLENWENLQKRPLQERKQILRKVFDDVHKHDTKDVQVDKRKFFADKAAEYKKDEPPWQLFMQSAEEAAVQDLEKAVMSGTLGGKGDSLGLHEYYSEFQPVADVEQEVAMTGDEIIHANWEEKQEQLLSKQEELEARIVPDAEKRDLQAAIKDLEDQKVNIRKEYEDQMAQLKATQKIFDERLAEEAILRAGAVPLVKNSRYLKAQFLGKGVAIPGSQAMFKAANALGGLPIIKGFRSNWAKAFVTPVSRSDEEMRLFVARLKNASPNIIEIHANRLTKALARFKTKDRVSMFAKMNYRYALDDAYGESVQKGSYFANKDYEKGDAAEQAFGAEIHKLLDELMPYYQNTHKVGEATLRVANINKHMKEPFRANTATTQKGIENADDMFHALMTKREKIVDEETGRSTWIDAPKGAREIKDPYELMWHVRIGVENTIAEEAFKNSINHTFGVRRGWSRNVKGNLIKRADEWHDGYNVTEKLGDHGWQTIEELGDGYFFPPESANDIRKMLDILKPENKNKFMGYVDQVIRAWKATVTIYNPGYYTRNGVGEIMSSWLAGVNTLTPYSKAAKLIGFAKREGGEMTELLDSYPLIAHAKLGDKAIEGHEVAFTMKNGEKITYRKLWAAYNDQGLRSGFFNTDFSLQAGRGMAGIGTKMRATPGLRKLPQAHTAIREWGERQENMFRAAHFIDVIMKHEGDFGDAILKARGEVVKYHFDYSDVTNFEKTVMMRAFPFYKWTRKAAPLMMASLFTNPGKMSLYPKVANALSNQLSSDDFVDDKNGFAPNFTGMAPAWVTNILGYQMSEPNEDGEFTAGRLATPQMDALSAVFNPLGAGYTLSNPFVKTAVEQASGRTFGGDAIAGAQGFNMDLNDPRYEDAEFDESDTRWKHFARMTPQGNFLQKGFGQKAGGDEEQISWQDAVGFATGLGVYDVQNVKPWVDYDESGQPFGDVNLDRRGRQR